MHTNELLERHQPQHLHHKQDVLGCNINQGSFDTLLDQVVHCARNNISSYVCFANVHMLYEANADEGFRTVLNASDIVCPDGKPVSLMLQALAGRRQERVCGMDFMPALLETAAHQTLSVFFYGSTSDVLDTIQSRIRTELPGLAVAGAYAPPFRPLSRQEDEEVIDLINNSGAQVVLVSLGCPKQEKWMHAHKGKINACMLGVGQAFRTYAGLEKRLPSPLRNLGVEWLYRLCIEPKRLWRRYLYSNTWFIVQCIKSLKPKK